MKWSGEAKWNGSWMNLESVMNNCRVMRVFALSDDRNERMNLKKSIIGRWKNVIGLEGDGDWTALSWSVKSLKEWSWKSVWWSVRTELKRWRMGCLEWWK